jgi:hypothetical protein
MFKVMVVVAAVCLAGTAQALPVATCRGAAGYEADFDGRRTFLWRPSDLGQIAGRWSDDPDLAPAKRALLADAEAALTSGPWSVTDKTRLPPSGDPHDYASLAPYWWPDNGADLPYVRHDGRVNPERDGDDYDAVRFSAMARAVEALALAHFYTGDTRYSDRAGTVLRAWFLDPATRMNPNLNFAQGIPGLETGRPVGIIDAHRMAPAVEAVGLLAGSGALTSAEEVDLRAWFGALVEWMLTSPLGIAEGNTLNNHAIHYDVMLAHYSLFAGDETIARRVLADYPQRRIAQQFAADGSLPEELARTRSFHYSASTLSSVYDLATLGECLGVDLWHTRLTDGRGPEQATAFLAGWAGREAAWPWPELRLETDTFHAALLRAARGYRSQELAAAAALYADREAERRINLVIAPLPGPGVD